MSSIVVAVVSLGGRFPLLTTDNDPNKLQHTPKPDNEQRTKSNTSVPKMKTDFDSLKNSSSTLFEPRRLELVHITKSDMQSTHRFKKVSNRVVSIDDHTMRKTISQIDDDAMTVETVKSCSTFDTFDNETMEVSTYESKIESAMRSQPMETMESSTKEKASSPINRYALRSIMTMPSMVFSDTFSDYCLLKSKSTSKFRILCSIEETIPSIDPKPQIIPASITRVNKSHGISTDPKSCHYSWDLDPISFLLKVNSRTSSSHEAKSLNGDMVDIPTDATIVESVDVEIEVPFSGQQHSDSSGMSGSFVTNAGVFVPAGVVPFRLTSADDDDKTVKTTNTAKSINMICEYSQSEFRGTSFEDVDDDIDDDYVYTQEVESFDNLNINKDSDACDVNTVANVASSNSESISIVANIESSSRIIPYYSIRTIVEPVMIDSISSEDSGIANGNGKLELSASTEVTMNILCGSEEDKSRLGNDDEKGISCLEQESSLTHSTTNTKTVGSAGTEPKTHSDAVVDDKTGESAADDAGGSKGAENSGKDADAIDEMTRNEQNNVAIAMKPATNIFKQDSIKTDLTVYGCTSFTAKHVLNYFMYTSMYINRQITVTLAGRSSGKLHNLKDEFARKMTNLCTVENKTSLGLLFDVFVADSSDASKLKDMAKRTKVVVNCAGPFAKYGTNVVAACAECGTDYVDITGEITWAGQMRVSYGEAAKKSGARIISFCGFDSIPSDISIFAAIQAVRDKVPAAKHLSIDEGTTWHCAEGAPNGGTVQTVQIIPLNLQRSFAQPVPFLADDPLVLAHPRQRFDPTNQGIKNEMAKSEWRNQLPKVELFVRFGVSIPFFMAIVNAKIVNASSIALGYGKNFVYRERMFPAGFVNTDKLSFLSVIPALIVQFGTMIAFVVLKLPVFGKMLVDYFFPPGSGPSDLACQSGKTEVYAQVTTEKDKNGEIHRANCRMKFTGDPGNFVTSQCLCEAAWCLLLNKNELPKKSDDGFGTPAELLGPVLLKRLMMTKVRTVAVRTSARQNVSKQEMSMFC